MTSNSAAGAGAEGSATPTDSNRPDSVTEKASSAVDLKNQRNRLSTRITAVILTCSSISLWFWSSFPWQHHNESLVWEISLAKVSFWETLTTSPVPVVANFRPLGMALAWITFHLTSGGIWLQQLVNFVLTVLAWAVACLACRNRLTFAWLSFICGGAFFSGYIYLFHLHGVFYPPLFAFLGTLLFHQSRSPSLGWRNTSTLLVVTVAVGMFHPFALLIFLAYVSGWWIECALNDRSARLSAALFSVGAAAVVAVLSLGKMSKMGNLAGDPMTGLLTSYRMLEANQLVITASILLTALAGLAIGKTRRQRLAHGVVAVVGALALALAGLPAILALICTCFFAALRQRRFALGALIAACAILPLATGTGSPTYGVFVLMPCILATADGLPPLLGSENFQCRLAALVAAAAFALSVVLRVGVDLPIVSAFVLPLRAEQEKTAQLTHVLDWIDHHPEVTGLLELCNPGGYPTKSDALNRTYRAPTDASYLARYANARFGPRLQTGSALYLCFGGQRIPDANVLYSIPGRWAGTASIQMPR